MIKIVCSKIRKQLDFEQYKFLQIYFLLILNSYTKFELNSLRNNEIKMKLQTFMVVMTKGKSEMMSYLNNGYDVMNYFAKFEKFLPDRIIIPSFMTFKSLMPELDWEVYCLI